MKSLKFCAVALLIATACAACKDKATAKAQPTPSGEAAAGVPNAPEAPAGAEAKPSEAPEPAPAGADVETPGERGRSADGPPADPASTENCCCKSARPQGDFEIEWIVEKACADKKGSCVPDSICDG
jgi:hypothetical protein